MTIGVKERILILGALPDVPMRVIRALREDLSFTPEEQAVLNVRTEDGVMKWDAEPQKQLDPRKLVGVIRLLVAAAFSQGD